MRRRNINSKRRNPFIAEFVMGAGETLTLPFVSGYIHNAMIDWGDGTSPTALTAHNVGNTHTYTAAGTYIVKIYGKIESWSFNNGGSKLNITKVLNWGESTFKYLIGAFYGCTKLTYIDNILSFSGSSLQFFATNCIAWETSLIYDWDTSNVTSLSQAFQNCTLFNGDISNWDISKVTSLSFTFLSCTNFNQDLSGWNTSSLAILIGTFQSCTNFNQDLSGWNVSKVTTLESTFQSCTNFNQDLSGWDISNVTSLYGTFRSAINLNFGISSWDVSKVTTLQNTFFQASNFNPVLSSWNVAIVTNMSSIISGSSMSVVNYSNFLIQCNAVTTKNNVALGAGTIKYNASAVAARDNLVNVRSWVITDGGLL
jgi:surface protein